MESIIKEFYEAFKSLDAESMAKCYHEDVVFKDPAFGKLHGDHAANMWRMLCESHKGRDFVVNFTNIRMKNETGFADWEAHYTFSKTGRRVHNLIQARFTFKDGKIFSHTDTFNLHKWAQQALGIKGLLLGGTGFFKKQLQAQTRNLLAKYEAKRQ